MKTVKTVIKKVSTLFLMLSFSAAFVYGDTKNVLFIGNSYTYSNNLPQMVADLALSAGDTLLFDSNALPGATFYAHSINSVTLSKIMMGGWDYVVLQGQSFEMVGYFTGIALPSPASGVLDSVIKLYNPCGETMFFRTWGYKNGFGTFSYELMDSLIHVNYMKTADTLNAVVSPVGDVWKHIRQNHPSIELYQPDESHPSVTGTYAAACCFYSAIFRKDPTLCSFNSTVPSTDAFNIKTSARIVVYDSLLNWHIGEHDSLFINCPITAIPELVNQSWNMYPNPATTTITLEFEKSSDDQIQLYNSKGFLVEEFNTKPTVTINVSKLTDGIYFVRQKGKLHGKKFIKE